MGVASLPGIGFLPNARFSNLFRAMLSSPPEPSGPLLALTLLLCTTGCAVTDGMTADTAQSRPDDPASSGKPAEGPIDPFLGVPVFDMQQVFRGERFPNVVVGVDGTVLALWANRGVKVRRSGDGGRTWGPESIIANPGFQGGGATVDETSGKIFAFTEERHPPAPVTVHWEKAPHNTRRRCAWSHDGGQTWQDWQLVEVLPDGCQKRSYGCMGGLTRLPVNNRDILLFSHLDTSTGRRERISVWGSFDGGKSWPIKRLVFDGPSAYSSMTAGRPDTPSEGWVYLQFEGGPGGGAQVAQFNLSWLLGGEATGDGALPDWLVGRGSR